MNGFNKSMQSGVTSIARSSCKLVPLCAVSLMLIFSLSGIANAEDITINNKLLTGVSKVYLKDGLICVLYDGGIARFTMEQLDSEFIKRHGLETPPSTAPQGGTSTTKGTNPSNYNTPTKIDSRTLDQKAFDTLQFTDSPEQVLQKLNASAVIRNDSPADKRKIRRSELGGRPFLRFEHDFFYFTLGREKFSTSPDNEWFYKEKLWIVEVEGYRSYPAEHQILIKDQWQLLRDMVIEKYGQPKSSTAFELHHPIWVTDRWLTGEKQITLMVKRFDSGEYGALMKYEWLPFTREIEATSNAATKDDKRRAINSF